MEAVSTRYVSRSPVVIHEPMGDVPCDMDKLGVPPAWIRAASGLYLPFTGIGSRETPSSMLVFMKALGAWFAQRGFTLRSGGAIGADRAFEAGHMRYAPPTLREIYRPLAVPTWAYTEAEKYLDWSWARWADTTRALIARNMQQILGRDGDSPTRFVLYWTANDDGASPQSGGTRYAVRCAHAHNIPTLNLGRKGSSTLADVTRWAETVVRGVA